MQLGITHCANSGMICTVGPNSVGAIGAIAPQSKIRRRRRCFESGTTWKLGYGFLFALHSNYDRIFSHFGDIQRQAMAWPWNLDFGSFKVIENGAVWQTMYDFLL